MALILGLLAYLRPFHLLTLNALVSIAYAHRSVKWFRLARTILVISLLFSLFWDVILLRSYAWMSLLEKECLGQTTH